MRSIQDLQQLQGLPLNLKIRMTKERIRQWIGEYGEDGVYVSFSGGKDSTVLLNLVREDYPNVKAVFVDTGLEYPEIRQFVKTYDNVEWLKPKIGFKQVIQKYGYPFISKEVSECVQGARKYLTKVIAESSLDRPTDRHTHTDLTNYVDSMSLQNQNRGWQTAKYQFEMEKLTGTGRYGKQSNMLQMTELGGADQSETLPISLEYVDGSQEQSFQVNGNTTTNLLGLAKQIAEQDLYSLNARTAMLIGAYTVDWGKTKKENIPKKDKSMFSQERYQFFLDAPFEISNLCCNVMKKEPVHRYQKKTGRNPMTAQMASENRLRTQNWLKSGCNGFDLKSPISNPMAFWTEQDVLMYIYTKKLPICSVYGDIVKDTEVEGQLDLEDVYGKELFDLGRPTLKTTGCNRTGCMFCGFGCHLEKPGEGRFERMKITHSKQYEYIMKPWHKGGLNYKEVIDWMNEHGNLDIKY